MYQPGGLEDGEYCLVHNFALEYLEHCEEGSAEFDQLVFKDDLKD